MPNNCDMYIANIKWLLWFICKYKGEFKNGN